MQEIERRNMEVKKYFGDRHIYTVIEVEDGETIQDALSLNFPGVHPRSLWAATSVYNLRGVNEVPTCSEFELKEGKLNLVVRSLR